MKISTTALWHNKKILAWLPKFGKTQSSVWVEWGAWLLEIVVRRRTPRALDGWDGEVKVWDIVPSSSTGSQTSSKSTTRQ